uniref:Uncharacterized protein n=1 Tax=Oryza sativa subsp. japonica TaxID=39947 RepID=Q6ZLH7_ORYSJ|nr:hypothetical protein [Oryza sativa Japonica Group]
MELACLTAEVSGCLVGDGAGGGRRCYAWRRQHCIQHPVLRPHMATAHNSAIGVRQRQRR